MVPVVTANFPSINDVSKNNNSEFLPKSSPTTKASKLESAFQSKKTADTAAIVAVRANGPLTAADNAAINRVAAAAIKHVETRHFGAEPGCRPTARPANCWWA